MLARTRQLVTQITSGLTETPRVIVENGFID